MSFAGAAIAALSIQTSSKIHHMLGSVSVKWYWSTFWLWAPLGVVGRKGAGKLRHVRDGQFWVQEKVETGQVSFRKVKDTENPAGLMSKVLTSRTTSRRSTWKATKAAPKEA